MYFKRIFRGKLSTVYIIRILSDIVKCLSEIFTISLFRGWIVIKSLKGFGQRLKNAIQNKKYSQKELSEILQVNQDTITNYVKEKSLPKADMLLNICDLLDISIDWLVKGDSDNNNVNIGQLRDEEKNIINIFRQLDSRDKEEVKLNLKMKYELMLERNKWDLLESTNISLRYN